MITYRFWSLLEAFSVSSHTEKLWYNETVCGRQYIYIYIYIYIYMVISIYLSIYILSDKLFYYITILLCGLTGEMFQGGNETHLTLHWSDILPQTILSVSGRILYVYLFTYTLSATWSAQFMRRAIALQLIWQPVKFPTGMFKGRTQVSFKNF